MKQQGGNAGGGAEDRPAIVHRADGRRPYLHVTVNTGDCGTVDHTLPGWRVLEWTSQVERVGALLAKGGGQMILAGGVFALASSNSGDDGQMAFTLMFDGDADSKIIGSYCDNPKIGHIWLRHIVDECAKMFGRSMPAYPFPPDTGRLDQPWLAVAYPPHMATFFLTQAGRYPLLWVQYEQLLVDAWQTMAHDQKATMRRNAAASPFLRRAFGEGEG